MPQSHAFLLVHVIFSTRNRTPAITPEVSSDLHAYLATVARNTGCECYRAGGIAGDFAWQQGYGAFSVGPKDLDALCGYIDSQEEHHCSRTFQEEYRAFLERYGIEYDERYLWE